MRDDHVDASIPPTDPADRRKPDPAGPVSAGEKMRALKFSPKRKWLLKIRHRLNHYAFQHIAHSKLAPDLLHIDGAPLVCEARVASDDEHRLEMR